MFSANWAIAVNLQVDLLYLHYRKLCLSICECLPVHVNDMRFVVGSKLFPIKLHVAMLNVVTVCGVETMKTYLGKHTLLFILYLPFF